jgi:GLPGLI family protein
MKINSVGKSIILFLFFAFNFISAQSGTVEYAIRVHEIVNSDNPEVKSILDKMVTLANKQEFELLFSTVGSSFKIVEDMSGVTKYEKAMIKVAKAANTTTFDIYYDQENDIQYSESDDGVVIKDTNSRKNWEITSESKTINDYLCYKALYKRNYIGRFGDARVDVIEAWFAPILPYRFGPKNYYGLPGLILELTDTKSTYLARRIDLEQNDIKIIFPKGKTVSKEEYDKKLRAQMGM